MKKIGVLAVQGDFQKHLQVLSKLNFPCAEVRTLRDLKSTSALIIPGGESTTILNHFKSSEMSEALKAYAKKYPVMGTCAGLIILARLVHNLSFKPLELIDIEVKRNAYGRQKESFVDSIALNLNGRPSVFSGVFIRAPKIIKLGKDVRILGTHKDDVVLASNQNIMVSTFHPELTPDNRIHEYFLQKFVS